MTNKILCLVLIVSILPIIGCGNGHVRMRGRVSYTDTGESLQTGIVTFLSPTLQAWGKIDKDGTYVIGTFDEKDGLPPGTYRVYVSEVDRYEDNPRGGTARRVPMIDPKYTSPETSGLEIDVDSSTKTFDFQVERNSKDFTKK